MNTKPIYEDKDNIKLGIELLDQNRSVAFGGIGPRTVAFQVTCDVSMFRSWAEENDLPVYRADKNKEWVQGKVIEVYDEPTNQIVRDILGPATMDERSEEPWFIALLKEL